MDGNHDLCPITEDDCTRTPAPTPRSSASSLIYVLVAVASFAALLAFLAVHHYLRAVGCSASLVARSASACSPARRLRR